MSVSYCIFLQERLMGGQPDKMNLDVSNGPLQVNIINYRIVLDITLQKMDYPIHCNLSIYFCRLDWTQNNI